MKKQLLSICLILLAFPLMAQKGAEVVSAPIQLDKEGFITKVVNYEANPGEWNYLGNLPCIIDFYADWCGPCRRIAPILDELAKEYAGKIIIYKINTDKQKELAGLFNVTSIPMLLFVPMQGQLQMAKGALSKEQFEDAIKNVLLKK